MQLRAFLIRRLRSGLEEKDCLSENDRRLFVTVQQKQKGELRKQTKLRRGTNVSVTRKKAGKDKRIAPREWKVSCSLAVGELFS
jgi:hypothetical protein